MKDEIIEIGKNLENDNGNIMEGIKDEILKLYSDIDDLVIKSDETRKKNKEERILYFGITIILILLALVGCKLAILKFIFTLLVSLVSIDYVITDFVTCKLETKKIEQLKELNEHILGIEEDTDNYFYESYVLTDYFKDEDYSLKRVKQMNEYLSKFDKDKPNSCFNEVGMKYNYVPYQMIEENKNIMIEDKKNKKDEVEVFSVTDTNLVDIPLENSITNNRGSVTNLDLKPSVFDKDKKVINKNNDYDHIEISIGKVKILTIDKRK